LAEQHRQEIEELMARVSTASENPPTSAELAHAPSSATEADRAQWEQDCQQMGNEITDLRSTLENLEQTLKNSEQTKEEIGKRLHTADMLKNEAQTKSDDLEQLLQLERSGAEAGKEQIKQLKGLQSKSEEIVSKAHRVLSRARSLSLSARVLLIVAQRFCFASTPEERLPSRVPKEEFGWMIFDKNLPWGTGARGKRRGFSPAAAVRHSHSARVYTEFFCKTPFFSIFFQKILVRLVPQESIFFKNHPAKFFLRDS